MGKSGCLGPMRRIHVLGLCVAAMFALGAIPAANASAASPEYFICAKAKHTGKYADRACSNLASPGPGNYERVVWTHAKKRSFTAKSEGSVIVDSVNAFGKNLQAGEPGKIEGSATCQTEKVKGEVTGPKTSTFKATYSNCSSEGASCNSPGHKKGVIVTDQLESELVWLDAAHTKVGSLVRGLGPGGRLEQNECPGVGLQVSVYGGLLLEGQGDNGIASKRVKVIGGEGPLHLQSIGGTYLEEAFGSPENDEHTAKRWWEYQEALVACEEGKEPFPSGEKSQATCEGFLGGPNPVATKPVLLEAVITSPKGNGVLPAVETVVSNGKGEAFGVAEGPFAP
jgi:hypothetical protein